MADFDISNEQEIELLRLPPKLSQAVDKAVDEFIKGHAEEGVEAYQRWHGADLWMVYANSVNSQLKALVTRRVTIAAYSDLPDKLRFIPDLVVTKHDGRYILPRHKKHFRDMQEMIEISDLAILFDAPVQVTEIGNHLNSAWESTTTLPVDDAKLLLP